MPDRIDCAQLAEEGAVFERVYALGELPRLADLLADPQGSLRARFAFEQVSGRAGAAVSVEAAPRLICQRCLQGVMLRVTGGSEIEFVGSESAAAIDAKRETYVMDHGMVSLRELAEEELLLALPVVALHAAPQICGAAQDEGGDIARPFAGLADLLKKT